MDRAHRHELKHDKFVDELGVLSSRAKENQRILLTVTGAVVAIALVAYGIYFYTSSRERKAQAALAAAIETIDSPLIQPGVPNPEAKFKTEEERAARAEAMFRDIRKKFGGTDAADVANLYLARIAVTRGDVAGARQMLEAFIREHPDHLLVGAARYSLYQVRIENGEAPQVINELTAELAKTEKQILPGDTLLVLLAHAYDAQGNAAKSRETYRRIVTQYPDSPYALEAQRRVGTA
ncbi:MAG TPA: tetratricopeptide repeat protein [Thermoanaerobaculia bacterium]|nr:tetratricopeptide repeat protein [Thermoanaerobaculia bacterium]